MSLLRSCQARPAKLMSGTISRPSSPPLMTDRHVFEGDFNGQRYRVTLRPEHEDPERGRA